MSPESPEHPEEPTIAPNFGATSVASTSPQLVDAPEVAEPQQAATAAIPEQLVLRFPGVYLLTSVSDDPTAIPDLQLDLSSTEVRVSRDDGSTVWKVSWAEVTEIAALERSILPGGEEGIVIVVTTRQNKTHRFVVPSVDPEALQASIESIAQLHHVQPELPDRAAPAIVATAVVLATAAVVAALLLMAGHVIHV